VARPIEGAADPAIRAATSGAATAVERTAGTPATIGPLVGKYNDEAISGL
jgi:hypothetical protein